MNRQKRQEQKRTLKIFLFAYHRGIGFNQLSKVFHPIGGREERVFLPRKLKADRGQKYYAAPMTAAKPKPYPLHQILSTWPYRRELRKAAYPGRSTKSLQNTSHTAHNSMPANTLSGNGCECLLPFWQLPSFLHGSLTARPAQQR